MDGSWVAWLIGLFSGHFEAEKIFGILGGMTPSPRPALRKHLGAGRFLREILMPKKTKVDKASATIRAAIDASKESRYALCLAAEVEQASVSRFMAGGDLKLSVASKLMTALGLEVRAKK